jgi:hypothetical protein
MFFLKSNRLAASLVEEPKELSFSFGAKEKN